MRTPDPHRVKSVAWSFLQDASRVLFSGARHCLALLRTLLRTLVRGFVRAWRYLVPHTKWGWLSVAAFVIFLLALREELFDVTIFVGRDTVRFAPGSATSGGLFRQPAFWVALLFAAALARTAERTASWLRSSLISGVTRIRTMPRVEVAEERLAPSAVSFLRTCRRRWRRVTGVSLLLLAGWSAYTAVASYGTPDGLALTFSQSSYNPEIDWHFGRSELRQLTRAATPGQPSLLENVTLDVRTPVIPPPFGHCDRWARVTITPEWNEDHGRPSLPDAGKRYLSFSFTGIVDPQSFRAYVEGSVLKSGVYSSAARSVLIGRSRDGPYGVPDFKLFLPSGSDLSDLTIMFRASLVHDRGTGSCWLNVPWAGGPIQARAISGDDAVYQIPQQGQVHILGGDVDEENSNLYASREQHIWPLKAQTAAALNSVIGPATTPDDWAALDASWKGSYHDAAILLAGVLLSLGFQLALAGGPRNDEPADRPPAPKASPSASSPRKD